MGAVIDLPRIRRALSELDRIAAEHPEMCQGIGQWTEKEVEKIIMGTPAKDRVKAMRERLAAQGIKREVFFATPWAQAALAELRALRPDQTRDAILCDAVISLLAAHEKPPPNSTYTPPAPYRADPPPPAMLLDLPVDRAELARRGHALLAAGLTAAGIAQEFNAKGRTPNKVPKAVGVKPRSDSPAAWTPKLISQLLLRDHPAQPDREAAP